MFEGVAQAQSELDVDDEFEEEEIGGGHDSVVLGYGEDIQKKLDLRPGK